MNGIAKLVIVTALSVTASAAHAETTLRWASRADVFSLDPNSITSTMNLAFLNHVYEGLVRYSKDFKIEPALATEWQIVDSEDGGKAWRFKLREGVKFHDGAEFTADDVVASFQRAGDPSSPLKGNMPLYKNVQKVDEYTVDIGVLSASSIFLNDITNIFMFDAGWLIDNGASAPTDYSAGTENYATNHTNGTGPFQLESRKPDAMTVLAMNPAWWDERPHNIDRLEYIPIASAATRVAALLSGEVDVIDSAPLQDIDRLRATPDVNLLLQPELRVILVGFSRKEKLQNGADNPFNDIRVRQAFELALDRDQVNQRIMRGHARPTGSMVAPEISGYVADLDTYRNADPEKARSLLKEAGKEGVSFTYTCANDGTTVNEEDFCQAIANMMTRAGFNPTIDIGPQAIQSPKRFRGEADVFNVTWANEPTLDAFSILSQIFHSQDGVWGVSNYGRWSVPALDALIEEAAETIDTQERLELEGEALKMARDQFLLVPLHQQPIAWASSKKVKEIDFRPDNKGRHWFTVMAE